ncbi:hypothetical protein BCV71DRAFT_263157 [Rhizopus microsporus]|uniref:F-box domain-containing protein n=1 Tax=Rhizopus microsporus TaxID=58291 RepID=A0A1X0S4N3_RHIZD|nr:hypothetical protein BCV71DRAFT_263157 [Rhizopus microsporus]
MHNNTPYLLQLPFDVIADISQYLDLCSRTSLMDTCRHMRHLFLSSKYLWKRIVFDVNMNDLSRTYSSLRKLGDSNGLRQLVQEVVMDDCDDPDLSPLIMLIKFPNLRVLSARNRKDTTNIEVDIKLLQEMLKFGHIKPKSLPIERTWNRLSIHPHVELDIKICGYISEDEKENEIERDLSLLEQQIRRLQMQLNNGRPTPSEDVYTERCQRIISVHASCWSCGYHFERCFRCVSVCNGCGLKRIPPMANDNQLRLKQRQQRAAYRQPALVDEDEFSVFG